MKLNILVTGASKGIGAAIAKRFLQDGYSVIVCSRSNKKLQELHSECKHLPGSLHITQSDISSNESLDNLIAFVHSIFGNQLDILVNNGGVFAPGSLLDIKQTDFQSMMNTNFWSAQYLTTQLQESIKASKGHIFTISSIAALDVYPGGEAYGITKAALSLYSKSLREALKGFGCRVTTVYPGATYTDSWSESDLPEERFMPAEDIAEVIFQTYLLSKRTVVEEITLRPLEGDI